MLRLRSSYIHQRSGAIEWRIGDRNAVPAALSLRRSWAVLQDDARGPTNDADTFNAFDDDSDMPTQSYRRTNQVPSFARVHRDAASRCARGPGSLGRRLASHPRQTGARSLLPQQAALLLRLHALQAGAPQPPAIPHDGAPGKRQVRGRLPGPSHGNRAALCDQGVRRPQGEQPGLQGAPFASTSRVQRQRGPHSPCPRSTRSCSGR